MLVYAERTNDAPNSEFAFSPFRFARILRIRKVGSAFYVDLQLSGFPAYASDAEKRAADVRQYRQAFQSVLWHPLPPLKGNRGLAWYDKGDLREYVAGQGSNGGYFFLMLDKRTAKSVALIQAKERADDQQAWERVVEVLGATQSFAKSTFFRIESVRRPSRGWPICPKAVRIAADSRTRESEYAIPAGDYALMSLRSYRPKGSLHKPDRTIKITAKGDGLVLASPEEVFVDSRYNEQRVVLASKRILDATVSPVVFSVVPDEVAERAECPKVIAPRIQLLLKVRPRWGTVCGVFLCFLIGPIVLSLGPDAWGRIIDVLPALPEVTTALKAFVTEFSMASKLLGGFIIAVGAYLGFRRLPLRS